MHHHQLVICSWRDGMPVIRRVIGTGWPGVGPGELKCPNGVAVDASSDAVYVVDFGNDRLQKFSLTTGERLCGVGTYGRPDDGPGVLRAPCDVALLGGLCYVSDTANNRVVAYEEDGPTGAFHEAMVFGRPGDGGGEFCGPSGIVGSPDGELFVADRYNHRVQCFNMNGLLRRVLGAGARSDAAGGFAEPFGLAFGRGNLYVSEWHGRRVQVLRPTGEPLQVLPLPRAAWLGGLCLLNDERACVLEPAAGGGMMHLLSVIGTPSAAAEAPDLAATVACAQTAIAALGPPTSDYLCPITMQRMVDPAVTADGHTYERLAIEQWLRTHDTSPMTGERLPNKTLSANGCAHQRAQALKRAEGLPKVGQSANGSN
jgi:sugar lactone lactonase YvrE